MTQLSEDPHPLGAHLERVTSPRSEVLPGSTGLAASYSRRGIFGVCTWWSSARLSLSPGHQNPCFWVGIGLVSGLLCSPNHRGGFRRCWRSVPRGRRAATPLRPHFVGAAVGLKLGTTAPPAPVGGGKRGQSGALLAAEALPCASYPCSPQHQQQDLGFERSLGASRQERCRAGTC